MTRRTDRHEFLFADPSHFCGLHCTTPVKANRIAASRKAVRWIDGRDTCEKRREEETVYVKRPGNHSTVFAPSHLRHSERSEESLCSADRRARSWSRPRNCESSSC